MPHELQNVLHHVRLHHVRLFAHRVADQRGDETPTKQLAHPVRID